MTNSLGKKIRFFRKREGFSQAQLEVEAGLAFGVVSRIESDTINPTKETVLKISRVLNLNNHELDYLLELQESNPSEEDIKKMITETQPWLDEELFPMYLIDNKIRGWAYNKMLLKIFDIEESVAKKLVGSNVDELLFSSALKIISKIPVNKLFQVIKEQVTQTKALTEIFSLEEYTKETIEKLKKHDLFAKAWDEPKTDVNKAMRTNFYMKYKGKTLNMLITMYKLFSDSRFLLVEYFPKDLVTAQIFEKIRKEVRDE